MELPADAKAIKCAKYQMHLGHLMGSRIMLSVG